MEFWWFKTDFDTNKRMISKIAKKWILPISTIYIFFLFLKSAKLYQPIFRLSHLSGWKVFFREKNFQN